MNYLVGRFVDDGAFVADAAFYFCSDARHFCDDVRKNFPSSKTVILERKVRTDGLVFKDTSNYKEI